jgi:hypothetical protein
MSSRQRQRLGRSLLQKYRLGRVITGAEDVVSSDAKSVHQEFFFILCRDWRKSAHVSRRFKNMLIK